MLTAHPAAGNAVDTFGKFLFQLEEMFGKQSEPYYYY